MGVRHRGKELLARLDCKSLDAQFVAEIQEGLNCSPFEGEAVLGVAREVYAPYFDTPGAEQPPGGLADFSAHGAPPPMASRQ